MEEAMEIEVEEEEATSMVVEEIKIHFFHEEEAISIVVEEIKISFLQEEEATFNVPTIGKAMTKEMWSVINVTCLGIIAMNVLQE